jgi:acetoin utilization deacetylase AcuC-like enzyme
MTRVGTGIAWDERFAWYDAGRASQSPWAEPYPALDRPEIKRRSWALVQASGLGARLVPIEPRPATRDELLRFHTAGYLDRVRSLGSQPGGGDAGESAWLGRHGFGIACLAAGTCIAATDAVLSGRVANAYALVRPSGHHAEPDRGRGLCIFGNVVLAVAHARAVHGVGRVAVIDWDVHHGNGTQTAFYDDPDVLTVSVHQDGYYPADSGGTDEIGAGRGRGANLNVPLPPGSGHGAYLAAFDEAVVPAVDRFRPELVVVASGYDAAVSDPLGRMLCHSDTFREMARRVLDLAGRHAGGRLVVVHEGGYSPTYVPFCALAVIEEMAGIRTPVEDPLLAWYRNLGGQSLQPHQRASVRAAAALLEAPAA